MRFTTPASVVDWLVRTIMGGNFESVFGRYYGTYKGIVEKVNDPDGGLRVMVRVAALGQKTAPEIWAPVIHGGGADHGMFFSPVVGDTVWVQFEAGDPGRPLVVGGMRPTSKTPSEFASTAADRRGIKTPSGHWIRFGDAEDDAHITVFAAGGGYVSLDKDGSVLLANKNGSNVYLNAKDGQTTLMDSSGAMVTIVDGDVTLVSKAGTAVTAGDTFQVLTPGDVVLSSGGKVSISAGSVDVGDAATQAAVLGTAFMTLYNSHTHVASAMGSPTSPPTVPMVPGSHVSMSVHVK